MIGPRILFLTQYDESGASSRIRTYQFLPHLERLGFQVEVRPLITSGVNALLQSLATQRNPFRLASVLARLALGYLRRYRHVVEGWSYDAVVVQKDVLPFGLRWLLRAGQDRLVYEFDDAIWSSQHSGETVGWMQEALSAYRKRLLVGMLRSSRLVVVDNSYLRSFALAHNPRVLVLTAPVDTGRYRVQREPHGERALLGWIGSPGTTYLLEALLPALEQLAAAMPIRLCNVGGLNLRSSCLEIANIPWSIENELHWLARMDVGLMPLDDRPFNRGRFGYKLVQYFSAGVPALAADVGLNREAVIPWQTGLLYAPDDARDFVARATELLSDRARLAEVAARCRATAEARYDLAVQAAQLARALREVTG